jgi:hypothetical protein
MSREEAIKEACKIVTMAYQAIGDYSHASDGFCDECEKNHGPLWTYSNQGFVLEFVRQAVIEKLTRDGYTVKG